jgi:predicted SnoaL-like aldol condensation-catalyzing enzyme
MHKCVIRDDTAGIQLGDRNVDDALEDFNTKRALEALDLLFNARDYEMAAQYWAPGFVQRAPQFPKGRHELIDLVRRLPETMRFEVLHVVAEDDFVSVCGRYTGLDGNHKNRACSHLLRMKDGVIAEQWCTTADEA